MTRSRPAPARPRRVAHHAIVFDASASPLWLVANEPSVNDLVAYLTAMRQRIAADPHGGHLFAFRRSQLTEVRGAFARMIRRGEEKLHRCCELLGAAYFESPYMMQSVVIGEVESTAERFTLVQPLSRVELYSQTDLDLGTRQLRRLGQFVKDVFGVKAIVGDAEQARALHASLQRLRWNAPALDAHGVPVLPSTTRLECIEVKDYMAAVGRKATGWEAIKSVFRWWDTMIEIQVQPLANYHREREALTAESHSGFKARREALRNEIAARMPLFGFYRDLLRWLFVCPTEPAPSYEAIEIRVEE